MAKRLVNRNKLIKAITELADCDLDELMKSKESSKIHLKWILFYLLRHELGYSTGKIKSVFGISATTINAGMRNVCEGKFNLTNTADKIVQYIETDDKLIFNDIISAQPVKLVKIRIPNYKTGKSEVLTMSMREVKERKLYAKIINDH